MVTFGGAYAVLPYVAQQASEKYHWLLPGQMMDGLGLAETTPGPLIMVVQFVGFLGAWNHPGELPRLFAASLGALLTTWVTFVPCFLWIFLGAPHIEQLRSNVWLRSSLSAITAAVVGVVLNLAVWFALHTMVPSIRSIDWFLVTLSVLCFVVMARWKVDIIPVILISAAAGLIYKMI
jgi:chromate transporter